MNYGILIDVILVVLFCGCVYLCARSGFVKTVATCIAVLIAAGSAWFLTARLSPYVARAMVNPLIERSLERSIEKHVSEDAMGTLDSAVDTVESVIEKVREKLQGEEDEETADAEAETVTDSDEEETAASKVTNAIGGAVTKFILFFLFFALILAILRVLIDSLSFLDRIPIVGPLNSALGFVLGLLVGFAVIAFPIWAVLRLVSPILGDTELLRPEMLEKSRVITFVARWIS